jgi:hypothetical protein
MNQYSDEIENTDTIGKYLYGNPQITFNKSIYKRYCDTIKQNFFYNPTNITLTDIFYKYSFEIYPSGDHLVLHNVYFCNETNIDINNISNISVYIIKNTNDTNNSTIVNVLHKFSFKSVKTLYSVFKRNTNDCMLEIPNIDFIYLPYLNTYGYHFLFEIQSYVPMPSIKLMFQTNLMLDLIEIKKFEELCGQTSEPNYMFLNGFESESFMNPEIPKIFNLYFRHIFDETVNITNDQNIINLKINNMQCCLFIMYFEPTNKAISMTIDGYLKIGEIQWNIDKYASNKKYGIENKNIYIWDAFNNFTEIKEIQAKGSILFKNPKLEFISNAEGKMNIIYLCYDILSINDKTKTISFFEQHGLIQEESIVVKHNKTEIDDQNVNYIIEEDNDEYIDEEYYKNSINQTINM